MIKKIFTSKKNIIIFIITLVVFFEIIMIVLFKSKPNNSPSQNQESVSPTPSINQTSPSPSNTNSPNSTSSSSVEKTNSSKTNEETLDLDYRRPLSRFLPYQGTYFKAIRYVGTNKLEILVKDKANTQLAKEEAKNWLAKNGVDQDDEIIVSYRY